MEERLVVSNRSKRIERNYGTEWVASKVEDCGNLRNGVYALHTAKPATPDPKTLYAGTIIHSNDQHVYQELGKNNIVRHDRHAFSKAPEIGRFTKIQYQQGRAQVVDKDHGHGQQIGR